MLAVEQIGTWCQGKWMAHHSDTIIEELIIDTRKINEPEKALFIALKAPRRDGHSFIPEAYKKGVRNFLVQEEIDISGFPGSNFILVKDTLLGLQQFIAQYRNQFSIPVIGITGSNGKTIVKEWLSELLSSKYNVVRSPKSYNSQIGVPLSVWLMEPQHEMAVFEAGISQPGEMERLEKMIRPTIGIFTNIGEAHSEGFMNMRQKINEKLILFRNASQLIYCSDYPELNEALAQYIHQLKGNSSISPLKLFTWSQKHDADLRITEMVNENGKTNIRARYREEELNITIPFTDHASVENAIH
jgi:Alr-MurF fusion protein